MRFIVVNIFLINFIISTAIAESKLPAAQDKHPQYCAMFEFLANQLLDDDMLINLANMYAFGKICDQNYNKALKCKQSLSHKWSLPMYSLNPTEQANTKSIKQLINKHNGTFVQKIFEFENLMINFLEPYNKGLGQNLLATIDRNEQGSKDNQAMLNRNGSASVDYCQLDNENLILLLLYIYPPKQGDFVIVDIGSGWGPCSKQLALLGYKVYSIDIEQRHLDFQKDNFCTMPLPDTFLYQYWKVNNPELLTEYFFKQHCSKIKENNIIYINGDFADKEVVKNIDTQWNIVLALDSLQFMNLEGWTNTFKFVDNNLSEDGIFIIKTKSKERYGVESPLIHDFDLHNMFHKIFSDYKVLNAMIIDGEIYGLTLIRPSVGE